VGRLLSQLAELNALCHDKLPGLSISLGAEIFFGEGVRRRLRSGVIPTLAGSEHVLVEFAPTVSKDYLEKAVRHLANGGFVTILAHMERYPVLVKDPAFARYLKEKYGALLQVNAETFLLPQRLSVRRFLKHAVPDGLVDFVASDAHGSLRRKTRLLEAYGKLVGLHGETAAWSLFQGNAVRLFSN
jgi:protein-tyrosine phosphatase